MTITACSGIEVSGLNFKNDFSGPLFYTRLGDVQRTRHGGLDREVGYQAYASIKLTPISSRDIRAAPRFPCMYLNVPYPASPMRSIVPSNRASYGAFCRLFTCATRIILPLATPTELANQT